MHDAHPLLIQIDGDAASEHLFPLYEGGESLAGIGLSFTRVGHYMLTGQVRHKAPYDPRLRIVARPPTRGSVEFDFLGFLLGPAPTTVFGSLTLGVTSGLVVALGIYILKQITRSGQVEPPHAIDSLINERPGDIAALGSSIIAPTKRAHNIIGHGATVININGNNNSVSLNEKTKDYVSTTIEHDHEIWLDVSVGSLNANQRTGAAYNYELGRVVPFDIAKSIDHQSLVVLSRSHSAYFTGNKESSRISIKPIFNSAVG